MTLSKKRALYLNPLAIEATESMKADNDQWTAVLHRDRPQEQQPPRVAKLLAEQEVPHR